MTEQVNINSPRALLGVSRKRARISTFFLDFFFKNMYTFDTEEVDLDQVDESVNAAMFIAPEVDGKVIKTRGHTTTSFKPASLKPKHDVDPKKVVKRRPGEGMGGEMSLQQRRNAIIVQNIQDEEKAIKQTEEWMAVKALVDGNYTCDGEEMPEPLNVDFGRSPENNIVLAGAASWTNQDKATFDPCEKIEEYAERSNGAIDVIVLDGKMWALLNSFEKFKEKLETRRGSNSQLETALKDLGKDVSIKGYLGDVMIVVYKGYRKVDGTRDYYLDDYTLFMTHTGVEHARLYGAIMDDDAIEQGMSETDRFPKLYKTTGDVARTYTVTKSAPLMANISPDDSVTIKLEP
ncbi:major capsid protein [Pseudoalteromonas ruthenica]|uniref:major capsid protein n=1 Tax=Pseudoalteromonas ruthenica TaxID=151081 RepID=UPI00110A8ED7|nr:major capsid protein [Pseudoalteromonas ruthenica]TMP23775.1 major capsid protein E [Pseudoalteromonas ruthenica]